MDSELVDFKHLQHCGGQTNTLQDLPIIIPYNSYANTAILHWICLKHEMSKMIHYKTLMRCIPIESECGSVGCLYLFWNQVIKHNNVINLYYMMV